MQVLGHTTTQQGAPLPIMSVAAQLADQPGIRLRWGGDYVSGAINGTCKLLTGVEQLARFGASGIPTVDYTTVPSQRDLWAQQGEMVLGRRLNHSQGKDIVIPGHLATCPRMSNGRALCTCKVLRRSKRWLERDYWVKYVYGVVSEWRLHIIKARSGELVSIARGQKVYTGGGPAPTIAPIVRSRRNGWTLRHDTPLPKGLRELAKKAVAACGYDLGAVDALALEDGTFKVLEVNSRPAVRDDYTTSKYVEALRRNYGTVRANAAG